MLRGPLIQRQSPSELQVSSMSHLHILPWFRTQPSWVLAEALGISDTEPHYPPSSAFPEDCNPLPREALQQQHEAFGSVAIKAWCEPQSYSHAHQKSSA